MTMPLQHLTARQLATVLATCFASWGDISPSVFDLVARGMAGDESIEDADTRLDSVAMGKALADAAAWIMGIITAPPLRGQ